MDASKKVITTIDDYIKDYPKDVQSMLQEMRQAIHEVAPQAVETISYKMPTFKLNNKALVYFAAFKDHIGFYPFPSAVEAFKKESTGFVTFKGTIQFPLDKPIPLDLVKKIVKYRIKERNESGY